jgi:CheY-like chemotaxis protein
MQLRKILIVEDSALHQKVYDIFLALYKRQGVELVHAENGQQALERLADHPDVDLVILDINMPVMSGLEFLHHIKKEKAFRDLCVVICSTEGADEDIRLGLSLGAKAYIKKPFRPEDLNTLIDRLFKANAQP